MMVIDHVLIAVADLNAAAERFQVTYGLVSVEGGRHPGWGTVNRVVPLGENYLELVAVVDASEASESVFGRWVAGGATESGHLLGWAVRTDDLNSVSRRLRLTPRPGSRMRRDLKPLRWRTAGIERAAAEPSLPFFIEWSRESIHPGRGQQNQAASITELALHGDPHRLSSWLGEHSLPISVEYGASAIAGLILDGPRGRIGLGADTDA